MSPTVTPHAAAAPVAPATAGELERAILTSRLVAWSTIVGLPALGFLAAVLAHLPLFAGAMAYAFLLAGALVCRRAIATFAGKMLRLLVAARLVIIITVGALLFCTSGSVWGGVVGAVLLWLVADRLLGRRALLDLWKLTTRRDNNP